MILLAQLNDDKNSIELLFDQEGLTMLRKIVNQDWKEPVENTNTLYDFDHEHLASLEWGGNELTPEFTSENASKIHSIKLVYLGLNAESYYNE